MKNIENVMSDINLKYQQWKMLSYLFIIVPYIGIKN